MEALETKSTISGLAYLADFARFLLKNRLKEFVQKSLQFSIEENLPLLTHFRQIPEAQLIEMGLLGTVEMLQAMENQNLATYIKKSIEQWESNSLPMISREMVLAADITLGSFVRRKTFRFFIHEFTSDAEVITRTLEEVDRFTVVVEGESLNAYIRIQQSKLEAINKQLSERQEQLNEAQALTQIGNWSWNIGSDTIEWSDQLYRIYGLEPQSEQITMERFLSLIHPEDREKRLEEIRISLETLVAKDYLMRIVTPGGELKVLKGRGDIVARNGMAIKLLGTCQDITEEYELQKENERYARQLELKNLELEHSNKELEAFNYAASHDLQEPLRKIQTFVGRINDTGFELPEQISDYFTRIERAAARMQRLIEDLLAFSQGTGKSMPVHPVDLNQVLQEVLNSLAIRIEEKKAEIICGQLPVLNAIPFQITQLFSNLIGNSLKYAKAGIPPRITVSSETVRSSGTLRDTFGVGKKLVKLSFSDEGIGFNQEYSERIFELFARLHGRDAYWGTGIGLAICKKIVQNHDGQIVAEGKEGFGAAFHIYLPYDRVVKQLN